MADATLIRLRPSGPWRSGPGDARGGDHLARLDSLFRSDRLFSALVLAARQLGWLDEWLDATARSTRPAVTFTSLFPYQGDTLFAPPPSTFWPPPSSLVTTPNPVFLSKIRWSAARFVPLSVIESMLIGQPILAGQWIPDSQSGCLLRRDRPSSSPFRSNRRSSAAVDRLTGTSAGAGFLACIEFESGSGLWTVARYSSPAAHNVWDARVQAAFRLLADSGFGGRRSIGWGHAAPPQFEHGSWPTLLLPKLAQRRNGAIVNGNGEPSLYWMFSLYSPSPADAVDWSAGDYKLVVRGGRVETVCASNALKKTVRMISEGSVLSSRTGLIGAALNVAPDDFPHPVYRCGFALALKLPTLSSAPEEPAESPHDKEALEMESKPCDEPAPVSEAAPSAVEANGTRGSRRANCAGSEQP